MNIEEYIEWFLERNFSIEIPSVYQYDEGIRVLIIKPTLSGAHMKENKEFFEKGLLKCFEKAKLFVENEISEIDVKKCKESSQYVQAEIIKNIFEDMDFEQLKSEVEKTIGHKIDYVKERGVNGSDGYIHYYNTDGTDDYLYITFKRFKKEVMNKTEI